MKKNQFISPKSIIAGFLLLLMLGLISLLRIPVSLLPEMDYPLITIETEYENASAAQVEQKITEVIEKNISLLSGLKYYRSISYPEKSVIYAVFHEGTSQDINRYYSAVREKIEVSRPQLPVDSGYPVVQILDTDNYAGFVFALEEDSFLNENYKEFSEYIGETLESSEKIARVDISGVPEQKVVIKPDFSSILSMGIKIKDIKEKIISNNIDFPGGTLYVGERELNINIKGRFTSLNELKNLIINIDSETKTATYLKDVAEVFISEIEDSYSFVNGKKTPVFEVFSNYGVTLNELSSEVSNLLNDIQIDYTVINDYSGYISNSVKELIFAVITAFLVTFFVVFYFFRSVKDSIIICSVIPVSILISFIMMYFMNISFNILTMSALVISVGLIVDNSIVVLERLKYYYKISSNYVKKTLYITIFPLISATLTTIIAFLPVIFIEGITGEFFRQSALAIAFTLTVSLVTALMLIPALFILTYKKEDSVTCKRKNCTTKLIVIITTFFYKRKWLSLTLTLAGLIIFFTGFVFIQKEFLPEVIESSFVVDIDLSEGGKDYISHEGAKLNYFLKDNLRNFIESESITINLNDKKIRLNVKTEPENTEYVFKKLNNYLDENRLNADVIQAPSWNIPESFRMYLRMNVYEENMEKLYNKTLDFEKEMKYSYFRENYQKHDVINIVPEPYKTEILDVEYNEISDSMKAAFSSIGLTDVIFDNNIIEVVFKNRDYFDNLNKYSIISRNNRRIYLDDIAGIRSGYEFSPIHRYEGKRSLQYRFSIFDNIDYHMNKLGEKVSEFNLEYSFSGVNEIRDSMVKDMIFAIIAALFLIYFILVIQYESFTMPFYIMILVPASYSGAFIMWHLTDVKLNLMSLLGIIILTGITVNNSILILSELKRKKSYIKAVISRKQPVFITTFTTVIGALPMLFGNTAQLRIPIALTIIGGMIVSWFFSLVLLPSIYSVKLNYEKSN
ncbi:MAG: efflux RND transporter permease subunit [Candidatus Muiribacteriota bacterium]